MASPGSSGQLPKRTKTSNDPDAMEEDADDITPLVKRTKRYVDMEGREVSDSAMSKATPDADRKKRALFFLIHVHEAYMAKFEKRDRDNIWYVAEITSIVETMHVREKQEHNEMGRMVQKIRTLGTSKIGTKVVQNTELIAIYKELLKAYGLMYSKTEEGMANTGIVNAYLAWFAIFKLRLAEARFGNTSIAVKKRGPRSESDQDLPDEYLIKIQSMGFRPYHSIFFGGSSYKPTLQRSIKQCLGPLTVLCNIVKQKDEKYAKTWMDTAMRMYGLIPGAEYLVHAFKNSRGTNPALNQAIGDLVMLGVCRAGNKAALPFAMLLNSAMLLHPPYKDKFGGNEITLTQIADTTVPDFIKEIDLTGKGLWKFYNTAAKVPYKMYKKGEKCQEYYPALIFYAIFNLFRDDLEVYETLTGLDAITRSDVGNHLTGPMNEGETVVVKLPIAKVGVKLTSASQTHLVEGSENKFIGMAQVSGKMFQRVEDLEPLFKALANTDNLTHLGTSADISRVTAEIRAVIEKLKKVIVANNGIYRGTADFYHITEVNGEFIIGEPFKDRVVAKGRYYFGPKI